MSDKRSSSGSHRIGNGWFGGLIAAVSLAAAAGDIHGGLYYAIGAGLMTLTVGLFLMSETKDREVFAHAREKRRSPDRSR